MSDRRFSLAGLLKLRKVQEEQASTAAVFAERRRRMAETTLVKTRDELGESTVVIDDMSQLAAVAAGRAAMSSMLQDLTELLATADSEAQEARERYLTAHRATSSIEKLAERHEREMRAADLRREQAELDEFAIQRSVRRDDTTGEEDDR